MDRRELLATGGGCLTIAIAGCQSDGESSDQSGAASTAVGELADSQPTIEAIDATPDDPVGELAVAFDAAVYERLEDGDQFWEADDGNAYLLGQYVLENTGDEPIDLAPGHLQIEADDEDAEWTVLVDGSRLDVELDPGETVDEWLVHIVPADVSTVTVTVDPFDPVAASVERDEGLDVTFPDA